MRAIFQTSLQIVPLSRNFLAQNLSHRKLPTTTKQDILKERLLQSIPSKHGNPHEWSKMTNSPLVFSIPPETHFTVIRTIARGKLIKSSASGDFGSIVESARAVGVHAIELAIVAFTLGRMPKDVDVLK